MPNLQQALRAIADHRLGDAIAALRTLAAETHDGEAAARLEALAENYAMMLQYMRSGAIDTERGKLFGKFLREAFDLCMSLGRSADIGRGTSLYATTAGVLRRMDIPQGMAALNSPAPSWRNVFDTVWTSPAWSDADDEAAQRLLDNEFAPEALRCLLLSATMLAALHYYDVRKHKFLLRAIGRTEPTLKSRAIVGAVMLNLVWEEACALHPELEAQWRILADEPQILTSLADLTAQFSLTLETKNIERRMKDDILPEVMNHTKKLRNAPGGLSADELQEEMERLQANPEWMAAEGRFADKMKEIIEMQQKGADVFIGSFKMMKQNFPFFSVAANWFCPFTPSHPDLPQGATEGNRFITLLTQGTHLCESDKYSFCLMLSQMQQAASGNAPLTEQLARQFEASGIDPATAAKPPTLQETLRSYVLDLYRYFKLFSRRDTAIDPFSTDLMLLRRSPFGSLLRAYPALRELADFIFSVKAYDQAAAIYPLLPPEAEVMQKLGYCHQTNGDYAAAIAAYEKANLMRGESAWTLRQLAVCSRRTGDLEKACAWYAELEQLLPEEADVALRYGECLVRLGRFDEALKKFYKTYYLAPDNRIARRAIAWCCLQTEQDEQAETYYAKILADAPEAEDWLNAGHAAWIMGEVKEAVVRYARHLQCLPDADGADLFAADRDFLIARGFSADELCIMADAARGGDITRTTTPY